MTSSRARRASSCVGEPGETGLTLGRRLASTELLLTLLLVATLVSTRGEGIVDVGFVGDEGDVVDPTALSGEEIVCGLAVRPTLLWSLADGRFNGVDGLSVITGDVSPLALASRWQPLSD